MSTVPLGCLALRNTPLPGHETQAGPCLGLPRWDPQREVPSLSLLTSVYLAYCHMGHITAWGLPGQPMRPSGP